MQHHIRAQHHERPPTSRATAGPLTSVTGQGRGERWGRSLELNSRDNPCWRICPSIAALAGPGTTRAMQWCVGAVTTPPARGNYPRNSIAGRASTTRLALRANLPHSAAWLLCSGAFMPPPVPRPFMAATAITWGILRHGCYRPAPTPLDRAARPAHTGRGSGLAVKTAPQGLAGHEACLRRLGRGRRVPSRRRSDRMVECTDLFLTHGAARG
jgi:hypothetical protein